MPNSYYNHGTVPATNAPGASAPMRAEFDAVTAGFALLPTLAANANKIVAVNAGATALTVISQLDGFPIGQVTPAAGSFTTLSATGATSLAALTATGATVLAAMTSTGINSSPIGQVTPAAGKFTTLVATGATTLAALSATSIDTSPIGQTTPAAGKFTTLVATGATTLAALTSTGINSSPVGATTPSTGAFTTLSATGATTLAAMSSTGINSSPIGQGTPAAGAFTALTATGTTSLFDTLNLSGSATISAAYGTTIALAANMAGATHRLFIGDGSGYSFKISKRLASVTTDLFSFSDGGVFTATGTGTVIGQFNGNGATALVVNSPATTNYSAFNARQNGNNTAFFGTDGSTGLVTGSADGDTIIRGEAGTIRLAIGATQFLTVAGSGHSTKLKDSGGTLLNAGFLEVPQNLQNANYTTVLSDSSKHIGHTSGSAHTHTIDSNANVAYPIGTTLTFWNGNAAGNVTIAITTDTMRIAGAGTTGSRTLTANGRATALKVAATEWQISGTNLT